MQYDVHIIQEPKQGIWAARASGFTKATRDIIICTDADARFPGQWLERIESEFTSTDTIAVCGPGRFYDGSWIKNKLADLLYMQVFFMSIGLAMGQKPLFGSNYAMRKSAWNDVKDLVHSSTEEVYDDIDLSFHFRQYITGFLRS